MTTVTVAGKLSPTTHGWRTDMITMTLINFVTASENILAKNDYLR